MFQTLYEPFLLQNTYIATKPQQNYKYVAYHTKIISPRTSPELKNQNNDVKQEVIYKPYNKTANYSNLRQRMHKIFDKYQNYEEYEINIRVADEVSYYLYNYTLAITFVIWRWFIR